MNRDGVQVPLDRIVPGDVFGEMSLLTGAPRSATVTAATDAVVFEIAQQDLEPIIQRRPELAEALARMMTERQARGVQAGWVEEAPNSPSGPDDLLARLRAFFKAR